jgi:hypothetical protein
MDTGSEYEKPSNLFNHRKVIEMEPSPLYVRPGKKTNSSHFFRNSECPCYDRCLNLAAREDLFLDCTQCSLKDKVMEMFSLYLKSSGIE